MVKLTNKEKQEIINQILEHYLICALWTDEEHLREENENVDLNIYNISTVSKIKCIEDIKKFLKLAGNAVKNISPEMLGHDIWLTRNGHGAGFWDRGYNENISKKLCESAKELKGSDIYLGNNGIIYLT
jgi:hypothetical protein